LAQIGRSLGVAFGTASDRRRQSKRERTNGNADGPYLHGDQFTSALLTGSSGPKADGTFLMDRYHLSGP
jgi:hypothetical protein